MGKSYLMLSLDDEKAKDLADVMGNRTCKKILSSLADGEKSESDISKDIGQPVNTIEYNLKKLISAGLVEKSKAFFWSVKGKKIPTYALSNKYIVIMPKSKISLKVFLPLVAVLSLAAAGIKYLSSTQISAAQDNAPQLVLKASESASGAMPVAALTENPALNWVMTTPWAVFLVGSLVAIGSYFLIKKIVRRS